MTDSVTAMTEDTATGMAEGGNAALTTTIPAIPFGAWPSPITAADVAAGALQIGFPIAIGGDTWWQESRPDENGRVTIMHRGPGGRQSELLPAPWNARTRVHEYGGGVVPPGPA